MTTNTRLPSAQGLAVTTATGSGAQQPALSLRAKVRLLTGATKFALHSEPSIGLAELRMSDGPTGVRGLKLHGGRKVALFPNATLLASTWSEEAAREVGQLLAEEALVQQIHVVLGPTVNLHRSLLGGRLFEQFSEDPLLTGLLAAAYVRGMQDNGVAACVKHLVANESETDRTTVNSVVDDATLRELYLLPFEIAVAESDPWSVMAAYNDVNGVAATEHDHLLNGILKGEWGYDGLVVSDWSATRTAGAAANGGLDLVMPGPDGPWGAALVAAVESGEVPESVVDGHLGRLLVLADRVGALGEARAYPADLPSPDSTVRREQLTRLAVGGMTVLTNRGSVLPLRRSATVALIGRHALETITMGGGAAGVTPPYEVSVAEGLRTLLGDAVGVTDGVEVRLHPVPARAGFVLDPETGRPGTHIRLYAADGALLDERHDSTADLVVGFDDEFPETVARIVIRGRLVTGPGVGPVQVGVIGAGNWVLRVGEVTMPMSLPGDSGFSADLLAPPAATTVVEPSGPVIVEATGTLIGRPSAGADADRFDHPPMLAGGSRLALVARPVPREEAAVLAEAARAAAAADVAVVVVGLTEEQETESIDKATLALPRAQDELVFTVAAAARRTVVVVNAATPVLMPWLDQVDAVLWAGLPGQEAGHAVAAALLGDLEPAGRLVTTFPSADAATPAWSVTPVDGDLRYTEGRFIGHRGHYAGRAPAPTFWFGHGLGYSTWDYGPPVLGTGMVAGGTTYPAVAVTVTNTGARASREVVQVYLEPTDPEQPVRLVGWGVANAAPGESVDVVVAIDERLRRRWDTATASWAELPLRGRLLVARGLGDVRGTTELL